MAETNEDRLHNICVGALQIPDLTTCDGRIMMKYKFRWDGMGYTAGTGVTTAQKIVQRPTPFLTQHSASPVGRGYSNEQSPPRSRAYRRIHTDRSDPITNTIFMKCTGDHQESLPNKDLVFGKIKDAISPSQPVGA